jgi:hypothetical protein
MGQFDTAADIGRLVREEVRPYRRLAPEDRITAEAVDIARRPGMRTGKHTRSPASGERAARRKNAAWE